MSDLWLESDHGALRARGSLKWTGTRGEIGAWVAESDLGTAPAVTAALHEAVGRGLTGYLPPRLRADLSEACADLQRRRYGWDVDPDRVHAVADVVQALRLTVEHLTPAGGPVVLPTPAYMPFVDVPRSWGRDVVQVPLVPGADGRPTLDLDQIDAALAPHGGLVVLVDPHNPTGRVHTRAELLGLAEVVERRGARVFADAVHAPLVHAGHRHVPYASVSDAAAAHTVTATAASKGWNVAGLKCAQVVLPAADDATWRALAQDPAEGISTLGAVAAVAAYREGEPWLDELVVYLGGNSHAFVGALTEHAPRVHVTAPEGTYLAWLDLRDTLPAGVDPATTAPGALGSWLRRRSGVTTVDGARCGTAGRGFVRANLATPRPVVLEIAERIGAALAG